jgi:pSer/pThr/pTyr-binding forkhead associated (FHA) protein
MDKETLDRFWQGCAAEAPLRLLVKLPGRPQAQEQFLQPFAVVGRAPHAHLRLEDAGVSLRHAYLQVLGKHLFALDLGSPTGFHLGNNSARAGWVAPGQRLGIGPYWLRWQSEDVTGKELPEFDPLAECVPGLAPVPLVLEFLTGKASRARWRVDRALTLIGSAAVCKVRLRSPRIAAVHCSLLWTAQGAWIVDLLGEGGLTVNSVPVPFAALEQGDQIQVGTFAIRVGRGASAAASVGGFSPPRQELMRVNGKSAQVSMEDAAASLLQTAEVLRMPSLAAPETVVDPSHTALVPLLQQFGAMQEQMADQFRQTLVMMFQMFSALHKDQMAFFQQEMDRVQELTRELHLLQMEAAKHAPGPAQPAQGEAPSARSSGPARPTAPPARPAAPRPPMPSETPSKSSPNQPTPAPASADPEAAAPAGQDIHVWLCQRMAAVQEERQNRWQKILSLLGGKRPESN